MCLGSAPRICNHGVHSKKPTGAIKRNDPFNTPSYAEPLAMYEKRDSEGRTPGVLKPGG
jgi:hypothetical protein